jgi:hypothetical protein
MSRALMRSGLLATDCNTDHNRTHRDAPYIVDMNTNGLNPSSYEERVIDESQPRTRDIDVMADLLPRPSDQAKHLIVEPSHDEA